MKHCERGEQRLNRTNTYCVRRKFIRVKVKKIVLYEASGFLMIQGEINLQEPQLREYRVWYNIESWISYAKIRYVYVVPYPVTL